LAVGDMLTVGLPIVSPHLGRLLWARGHKKVSCDLRLGPRPVVLCQVRLVPSVVVVHAGLAPTKVAGGGGGGGGGTVTR
jgi:hypothetical protein